jgi:glycerophosphoryl diester phosphodiesterase family protein
VTIGSVLEQTFGLYQRFFWRFVAITAIVMVALDLVAALAFGSGSELVWLLVIFLSFVGTFWVQGALAFAVADVRDGTADSPIGELYSRVRPVLGTLVITSLLAGLGIAIGFVLLIAPGLYLLARWALVVPAVVLERRGIGEAFARSSELTSGYRWKMLAIVLITSIGSGIFGGIVSLIVDAVIPGFVGVWLGQLVADSITVPFVAVALTVTYFNLVRLSEPTPELDPGAASEPDSGPATA